MLGLGCAHLGNPNKGTDEEAIEAVRHAIDLGINFVAKGVGVIIGSVFCIGLLAGAEPNVEEEKRRYPDREPRARAMWRWCEDRGLNVRHLAMQFCLAAPIESIVLSGPANKREVIESFESATEAVADDVWRDFRGVFGVGIK